MLEYLNKYFDKFIKQYHPYENKELYQILIKFIQENFLVDSYDVIPTLFKTLYENHTLIPDIYDIILESLGYDKQLLLSLTFNQKKIILNNFPNYHHDKGDLKSCIKICKVFNEPIKIYELYIDYRVSTNLFDWYFIPKPLYQKANTIDDDIIPLNYDEVYNKTPSYFVNKASLINAYNKKSIKLPLKSNLILLEISSITSSDELTNLTIATTLFYYKNLEIPIYINDKVFSITILGLYQLWQYLLILFFNKIDTFESNKPIILYNLDVDEFQYTLDVNLPNNLQQVAAEYNDLSEMTDIVDFYESKFKNIFLDHIVPHIVTIDSIKRNLAFSIDLTLIQYIENIINTPTAESISSILVDLRNSFDNYRININTDSLFNEYSSVLLNVFELALINPTNTATYKLINFFKPYHTQLITKFQYGIEYKSKFTNALLRQTVMFVTHQYEASACVISTDIWFTEKISGVCDVNNSNLIVVSDEIANQFNGPFNEYVYWEDPHNDYPIDFCRLVISKFWTAGTPGYWTLTLDSPYTGPTGIFNYCYKRYHGIEY